MNTNRKPHLKEFKWAKGNPSPNPTGRPKSLKTMLKTETGLTQTQCNDLILSMLSKTKQEIDDVTNNNDSAIFVRIVGKALLKSYNNGSLYALESLLNRSVGMPKQQVDTTLTTEKPIFVSLNLDNK